MIFIKLTNHSQGEAFYVNIDNIHGLCKYKDELNEGHTCIYIWPCVVAVKETPEQILEMIEKARLYTCDRMTVGHRSLHEQT